jgi:hypothetical protein
VNEPTSRPFFFALAGLGLLVAIGIGFSIFNIVDHATHKTSVTPVITKVISVTPSGASEVTIVAQVTSAAPNVAQVSCLVGVELPATPLAFPIRVNEQLAPGQTQTITVTRQLIKPKAQEVQLQDVAFTCT